MFNKKSDDHNNNNKTSRPYRNEHKLSYLSLWFHRNFKFA